MGSSVFNLNEEIFDDCSIESSLLIILSCTVYFLWFFNIISFIQFIFLFMFYTTWIIIIFSTNNKLNNIIQNIDNIKKNADEKYNICQTKLYDLKKEIENKYN